MGSKTNIQKIADTVRIKIQSANAFWNEGKYKEAVDNYKDASVLYEKYNGNPKELLDLYKKIYVGYSRIGEYKKAASYYDILIKHFKNDAAFYQITAEQYSGYDDNKTLECYLKALELGADESVFTSATWMMMKNSKYTQKQFKEFCEKYVDSFRPKYLEKMPAYHHEKGNKDKKLNIGYVSTDFYCHAMMSFILPILENHDKEKYNFYLYALNSKQDSVTERIKQTNMKFVDLSNATPQEIAKKIYEDKIDIVVDLAGYINTKAFWLYYKPAPIQMQYLGFLNTYGMKEVDYIIADEFSIPPEQADEYTETPMYLEHGMQKYCFSRQETVIPDVPIISPVLRHGYITFGCFNTISKIDNETVALWAKLLETIPKSKILVYRTQMTDKNRDGLERMFKQNNVDMSRIEFKLSKETKSHFEIYAEADIALDPMPFSGLTVTFETMLMGVPVLCINGKTLQSKGTARVNTMLGMDDFVAQNSDDFIEKAKKIAVAEDLIQYRLHMRDKVKNSELFNNYRVIAQDFENCFDKAWAKYCTE